MQSNLGLKLFPDPLSSPDEDYLWDHLVVGINRFDLNSYPDMVESLWKSLSHFVNKIRSFNIEFGEESWFHLRRRLHQHKEPNLMQQAWGRIEILRLKRGFIDQREYESIRIICCEIDDVSCAGWWALNFTDPHDNTFLSFLQKLSRLRVIDGIMHEKYLGQISDDYDKCPFCIEAYGVMRTVNSSWSEALQPWFDYMTDINMDAKNTHEYAHWFGQILSGWPEGAS
ncbi:MAG: hypothetical protein IH948_08405 [Bacteroidetes bacterium]|nr:hypothetical protein [Bacteroidota bacterium]